MESYIEITLIHHLFFMYITIEYASLLTKQYLNKVKLYSYILFISVVGITQYHSYALYYVIFAEMIGYYLFYYCRNTYLIQLLLRIILELILYLLYDGTIYNLIYFINTNKIPYVFIVIELLCLLYMKSYKRYDVLVENMYYEVKITIHDRCKKLILYLDTGNELSCDGIPVVMIQQRFESFFNLSQPHFIRMKTLSGVSDIVAYKGFICYLDGIERSCYFHFCNLNHLKKECHGLLNMKLMVR